MASYEICTTVSYSLVIFFFGLGMISGWPFEVEVKVSLSSTASLGVSSFSNTAFFLGTVRTRRIYWTGQTNRSGVHA